MQNTFDNKINVLVWLSGLLIAIHAINVWFLHGQLMKYGVQPGNLRSLPYIFTAPFIHGSWTHLFQNLFGLIIFGGLCLFRGIGFFLRSSFIIILITGVLVWAFARPSIHIGASGWIFGLWSLSIAIAWFQRSFRNIAIAVFVIAFYGGMVFGVLPSQSHISFESHLFGAIAGVVCAYFMAKNKSLKKM